MSCDAYPSRHILEGVPRIAFEVQGDRCPECVPFISALRACLEYLGEEFGHHHITEHGKGWRLDCLYTYLMGVSGAAFRLSWREGWHPDNVEIMYMSPDPAAPFDRAFKAVGYSYDNVRVEDGCRARIMESLHAGHPVIAFGIIGPPEACIVTGYDEAGDVLIGWNFFQHLSEFNAGVEFEPSGYFRKRGWFPATEALILIREKHARPPLDEVYRDALCWALTIGRTSGGWPGRANGHAAYQTWADHLLRDTDFVGKALPALHERLMVHTDAVSTVAEGRWYGAQFLTRAADAIHVVNGYLEAAAECYRAEHDLMLKTWDVLGGQERSDKTALRLAEPDVRRELAALIYQARDKDIEAINHIERALIN